MLSDAERSMALVELARAPHALAETFTEEGFARTPSCGDEVTVRVTVIPATATDPARIEELTWTGHGCIVSMAASTALAALAPMTVPEFSAHYVRFRETVKDESDHWHESGSDESHLADFEPFAGIGRFALRAQCATLAWRVLDTALGYPEIAGPPHAASY